MKLRLHPVLVPFFLALMLTGGLSFYALVFLSLLLHEAGHIIAAYMSGMKVRMCTIMPYGGELHIPGKFQYAKKQKIIVALGGPMATLIILLLSIFLTFPGDEQLVRIQTVILFVNLLPILPLDGGQALGTLLETEKNKYAIRASFLLFSLAFLAIGIVLMIPRLPHTLLFIALAIFLLIQNVTTFRFRKYEQAFERLKENS
ncbi:hypothetical protein QWT69_06430 [Sporosarcina oncorhynchi]|uniref:Peptidase M50 domain-containing protein n=1 Tax=Sporosarcina oncorhynchi TaxID=3056444 RepID=A0ABZ0L8B6_9BACL|nr:site-2 protease family protein [Sporosarcina sp. T2O-4]WOV88740.1 hypothetical protein QWT69_06430 [Sporosarcina sp. T2O-4]